MGAARLLPAAGALAALVLLAVLYVTAPPAGPGTGVPGADPSPSLRATLAPTGTARNGLMAYVSGGDVWVVGPDGAEPHRLTAAPARDHDPVWSPGGTRLAYWSDPHALRVMRADGSDDLVIYDGVTGGPPVSWAPDSGQLAWGALVGNQVRGIVGVALDLPDKPWVVAEHATLPAWSPNGTAMAFVEDSTVADGPLFLSVAGIDGSDRHTITRVSYRVIDQPRWSTDGRRLAFAAGDTDGARHVYVLDLAGGFERRVSSVDGDEWDPIWSPDGRSLAFLRRASGRRVQIVQTAGSLDGTEAVTETSLGTTHITWAPDGARFLLTVQDLFGNGTDLSVVDAVSGEQAWAMRIDSTDITADWQRLAP